MSENFDVFNNSKYYLVFPNEVFFSKELSISEKFLYGLISNLANKDGYCFAQNKYLGEILNASNRTISRWLSKLSSLNYIKIEIVRTETGEIKQRKIYINNDPSVTYQPSVDEGSTLETSLYATDDVTHDTNIHTLNAKSDVILRHGWRNKYININNIYTHTLYNKQPERLFARRKF